MAAALLTPETVTLHNIPYVRDIITQRQNEDEHGSSLEHRMQQNATHDSANGRSSQTARRTAVAR